MRIVAKVFGYRYPGIRAIGTGRPRLHTVLGAALGTDITGMPYPSVWGDVDLPNMVMAESVTRVVVEKVLLLLYGGSQSSVLVAYCSQLQ